MINSKSQTTVEGLDDLIKAFADLGEEAMPYLQDAANEAGQMALAKAQQKAPVDTGELKKGLKLTKAKLSSKNPMTIFSKVGFTPKVYYGVFVELGHRLKISGKTVGAVKERPFLRPAADESKEQVVSIVAEAMNKALDKMGGVK